MPGTSRKFGILNAENICGGKQKKVIKKFFLLFFLLIIILSPILSQSNKKETFQISQAIKYFKSYKNIDKIVVNEKNTIILKNDGSYVEKIYQLSTAIDERGIQSLSYIFFFYNKKYSNISVDSASVIRKNREKIEVPNEYIKYSPVGNKNDGFMELFIKFPKLYAGDSITYSITLNSKSPIDGNYCEIFPFQYQSPIYQKTVEINTPPNLKLFYKWRNKEYFSKKSKSKSGIKYFFEVMKSPPLKVKSKYFSLFDIAPTLYVSTISNWKELSRIGYKESANSFDFSKEMENKFKELTLNQKSLEDKIFSIYHYITNDISFNQYSLNRGALLPPKKASEIFKSKHAMCQEKSVLLMAFLKKLGLNPIECLVNLNSRTFRDIPSYYFDHMIVMVKLKNGKTLYLDPLSSPATYKGTTLVGDRYILPLTKKGSDLKKIPHIPSDRNKLSLTADSVYRIDGIFKSSITIETYGVYDTFYRSILKRIGTFKIGAFFNNLVKYIHPDAKIPIPPDYVEYDNYKTNEAILLGIEVNDFPTKLKNFFLFKPVLSNGVFDPYITGLINQYSNIDKIKYPIYLISPVSVEINEKLTLPNSDYKFITYPDDINFKSKFINYSLKFNIKKNSITYKLNLNIETFIITPEEFKNFKMICKNLLKLRDAIILVKYSPIHKSQIGGKNEEK